MHFPRFGCYGCRHSARRERRLMRLEQCPCIISFHKKKSVDYYYSVFFHTGLECFVSLCSGERRASLMLNTIFSIHSTFPYSVFRIPYSVFRIPYSVFCAVLCILRHIPYCVFCAVLCILRRILRHIPYYVFCAVLCILRRIARKYGYREEII